MVKGERVQDSLSAIDASLPHLAVLQLRRCIPAAHPPPASSSSRACIEPFFNNARILFPITHTVTGPGCCQLRNRQGGSSPETVSPQVQSRSADRLNTRGIPTQPCASLSSWCAPPPPSQRSKRSAGPTGPVGMPAALDAPCGLNSPSQGERVGTI